MNFSLSDSIYSIMDLFTDFGIFFCIILLEPVKMSLLSSFNFKQVYSILSLLNFFKFGIVREEHKFLWVVASQLRPSKVNHLFHVFLYSDHSFPSLCCHHSPVISAPASFHFRHRLVCLLLHLHEILKHCLVHLHFFIN